MSSVSSSKGVEAAVVGLFRFGCDVDLFYSDIDQTMVMSRAAAERALAQADAT